MTIYDVSDISMKLLFNRDMIRYANRMIAKGKDDERGEKFLNKCEGPTDYVMGEVRKFIGRGVTHLGGNRFSYGDGGIMVIDGIACFESDYEAFKAARAAFKAARAR